jgi:hypothetical protein
VGVGGRLVDPTVVGQGRLDELTGRARALVSAVVAAREHPPAAQT